MHQHTFFFYFYFNGHDMNKFLCLCAVNDRKTFASVCVANHLISSSIDISGCIIIILAHTTTTDRSVKKFIK
jgi:hypothetical protein